MRGVLIVAKCNVNQDFEEPCFFVHVVLIVAKCNVNKKENI